MRLALALILLAGSALADSFVFAKEGKIISGPRDLPSVGVRLDNGQAVLGLHGASDAVKAACGWFRVIPSAQKAATNQVVVGSTYTLNKDTAQEVLSFGTRETITVQDRLAFILETIPGTNDDARVTALIKAVATCVTGKIDKAISITVPAKTAEAVK